MEQQPQVFMEGVGFEGAIQKLKDGSKIRRQVWPEGAYAKKVEGTAIRDALRTVVPEADGYTDGIIIVVPGKPFNAWNAAPDDVFADDWQVYV